MSYLERYGVVDDHWLSEHVGGVFGIGEFGVEVESELWVVVHLFVAEYHELTALRSWGSEDDNVLETWYRASLRDATGATQVKKCFLCAGSAKKQPVGRLGFFFFS